MNPLFRIDFSISDSLKIVRKSVLIYETIIGATKIGSFWVVPKEAEKPRDQRVKSGKYIKS